MELRDTFSDRNNIDRLINIFQKAILDSEERIQDIEQDEQKGIQKFSLANEVVISNIRSSIFWCNSFERKISKIILKTLTIWLLKGQKFRVF